MHPATFGLGFWLGWGRLGIEPGRGVPLCCRCLVCSPPLPALCSAPACYRYPYVSVCNGRGCDAPRHDLQFRQCGGLRSILPPLGALIVDEHLVRKRTIRGARRALRARSPARIVRTRSSTLAGCSAIVFAIAHRLPVRDRAPGGRPARHARQRFRRWSIFRAVSAASQTPRRARRATGELGRAATNRRTRLSAGRRDTRD